MTPEQHAAVIRSLEGPMAEAYLAEVRAVESLATVAEIERLIAEDDREGILAYLMLGLGAFLELARSAFILGANNESAGRFRFDANDWNIVNLIRQEAEGVRYGVEVDLRKSIGVVSENGRTISNQALDILGVRGGNSVSRIGGVLGLTGQMTEWVENARNQLTSQDPSKLRAYLRRKEREVAFDVAVKDMISKQEEAIMKVGVGSQDPTAPIPTYSSSPSSMPPVAATASTAIPKMSQAAAGKIAKAYAGKLSKANADRISKQTASSAYNAGRNEAIKQMIARGFISPADVTKRWRTMRDERVRHSHATMNNQRVSFIQPFVSGIGGLMMYPSDQSLGASDEDIYGCRCVAEYTIKRRF